MTQISGVDLLSQQIITLKGELLCIAPLSFWGGLDSTSGMIIDARHPSFGICLSHKIVQMPYAKGSSSSSSVLLEAIRLGTAPKAMILERPDPILLVAVLVAFELYQLSMPILVQPA